MSTAPLSKIYLRSPPEPGKKAASRTYIIYFLTGNPGLIEYYRTFLTHLYGLLSRDTASNRNVEFQVYGRSLSGFEMNESEIKTMKWRKQPPYGLQDQIRHAEEDVVDLVDEVKDQGGKDVRVVLVGHSVGSYISLEIIRRLRAHGMAGEDFDTRLVGAVGLFPTVVDIARSESGLKASPFLKNSNFATVASILVSFLTFLLPVSLIATLVAKVMGFPGDAAQTTASFIKSPFGIQQALHMARDEMFQIDTDIWDEDIWGATEPSKHPHPRPTLRFLFARKDHWVADATRDALISSRGRFSQGGVEEIEGVGENWKPVMEIDDREGWPHGFCISHSVPVAERVAGYVRDIVGQDMHRK
ncbi:Nn.00g067760.m01.CDS01 [Neocucurbitaria sp. VM-36]